MFKACQQIWEFGRIRDANLDHVHVSPNRPLAQAPISPTAFFPQNLGNSVNCTVKGWKGQSQREPKAQIDRVTISHTSLDRVSPGCFLSYTMFPEYLEIAKRHKAQWESVFTVHQNHHMKSTTKTKSTK